MSYQTLSGSLNGRPIRIPWLQNTPSAVIEVHDTPSDKKHLVTLEFGLDPRSWAGSTTQAVVILVQHNGDVFERTLQFDEKGINGMGATPAPGRLTMLVDNTQVLGDSRILVQVMGYDAGSGLDDSHLSILGYAEEVA